MKELTPDQVPDGVEVSVKKTLVGWQGVAAGETLTARSPHPMYGTADAAAAAAVAAYISHGKVDAEVKATEANGNRSKQG